MRFVEERDFTLRLDLRCTFEDGYEGELEGFVWLGEFQDRILPRVVDAAVRAIRAHLGWAVRPGNRGRAVEGELSLVVERDPG